MFRGEVWELAGRAKKGQGYAPQVVIISADALGSIPLRVVVPLTPWQEKYAHAPWIMRMPPVLNSGLEKAQAADALQVRSVSISRSTGAWGRFPQVSPLKLPRGRHGYQPAGADRIIISHHFLLLERLMKKTRSFLP